MAGVRIICDLMARRSCQGCKPSQTRPPGAAFKNRRDAPVIYDRPGGISRDLEVADYFRHGAPVGGESMHLVPNGSNQPTIRTASEIRNEAPAIASDLPNHRVVSRDECAKALSKTKST